MGSGAPFFGRAAELALLSAQAAAANTGEGRERYRWDGWEWRWGGNRVRSGL